MYYVDGSVYEGEWLDDKRSGKGLLRLRKYLMDMCVWYVFCMVYSTLLPSALISTLPPPSANGNRYEGLWSRGMKNGEGKFFYMDRGQVYTGNWVDDIAKCGTLEDADRDTVANAPPYPIPPVSDHETASFEWC